MIIPDKAQRILWYENIGFFSIILLSWINELLDLPHRLFGDITQINWHEGAMETTLILLVWVPVHLVTKRLVDRLHYLEGFFRMCAWCRKVAHDDEWMPLERYLERGFQIKTSHGICPDCSRKAMPKSTDTPS
jgi:hypothetical protein